MYSIRYSGLFKKQLRLMSKRGKNLAKINEVVLLLSETGNLPANYRPHKLKGDYTGYWEAHIEPDWLLVWEIKESELVLILIATGSHSDLF
jgi:mRNA interferase YafQ